MNIPFVISVCCACDSVLSCGGRLDNVSAAKSWNVGAFSLDTILIGNLLSSGILENDSYTFPSNSSIESLLDNYSVNIL